MKIVVIGGHLTPALAVIEALPKNTEIIYFGRKYTFEKDRTLSLEFQTITQRDIPFISLTTGRIQRKFSLQTIPSLTKIPYGFFHSFSLLRKYKPDCIIGFGGYLSVPVVIAGKLLDIPIIIHEQTLESGFANKFLAKYANAICISWPSSAKFFPQNKTILTGNPIVQIKNLPAGRQGQKSPTRGLTSLPKALGSLPVAKGQKIKSIIKKEIHMSLLCIFGGSSGSHAINVLIEGCLEELLEKFIVFHQTGDAQEFQDYDRLSMRKEALPEKLQKRYTIMKYIDPEDFIPILQESDIVISRCGINTITTLLLLKKKSLLIPLPFSQRNEQYKNALLLKDAGIAEILDQQTVTAKILFDNIVIMHNNKIANENKIQKNKEKIFETNNPLSAAEKIVVVINDFYQRQAKKKTKSAS